MSQVRTHTGHTDELESKFIRLGLKQTRPGVWVWTGNDCRVTVTGPAGTTVPYLKAVWTDGHWTDVTFFDCDTSNLRDLTIWLNFYLRGGRLNEQGTIGFANGKP